MGISREEIAFATELFEGLGEITTRRMMGGLCLYHRGTIFAIVHAEHGIMLKARGDFIARIAHLGATQWTHERPGKAPVAMPYWTLPDGMTEDPEAAVTLAREALRFL